MDMEPRTVRVGGANPRGFAGARAECVRWRGTCRRRRWRLRTSNESKSRDSEGNATHYTADAACEKRDARIRGGAERGAGFSPVVRRIAGAERVRERAAQSRHRIARGAVVRRRAPPDRFARGDSKSCAVGTGRRPHRGGSGGSYQRGDHGRVLVRPGGWPVDQFAAELMKNVSIL